MKKVLGYPDLEKHLYGQDSCVTSLSFDPSSKQLASGSKDHSIMIWNLKANDRAFKFMGHKDVVTDVSYSPVGELLASASQDGTVRLWVPTVSGSSGEFTAHMKAVQSVCFSHDGQRLLTASNDKSAKEWSVQKRTYVSTFTGHTAWIRSARYCHQSKTIVTASDDKRVKLFDHRGRNCVHTFTENKAPLKAVFHPSDAFIAVALEKGVIKIYDLRTHKHLQLYKCHDGEDVTSVEFHPNANYLFSSSKDGTSKIIDLYEGRVVYTLKGNRGPLTSVAVSPDGNQFALAGSDGEILLWKVGVNEAEGNATVPFDNTELASQDVSTADESGLDEDWEAWKENVKPIVENESRFRGKTDITPRTSESELEIDSVIKTIFSKIDDVYELALTLESKVEALNKKCKNLEEMHSGLT